MDDHAHAIVTLCLSCLPLLCIVHAFIHQYFCISFRYARCTMCGHETRDDGTESQDDEWWMHLEDGRMDPDVHDRRKMLAEQLSFN